MTVIRSFFLLSFFMYHSSKEGDCAPAVQDGKNRARKIKEALVNGNHHIGGFDHCIHFLPFDEAKVFSGFFGNDGNI